LRECEPLERQIIVGAMNETPDRDRDEAELREIPLRMIAAWNRGDGDAFAAPFTDTADFIAFEGTHLHGRAEIAAFHRELFATTVHGTKLEGGVRFVRLLTVDLAVVHAWARYATLPGADQPVAGRESMQLFVVTRRDGGWLAEAMQNSRQLTLDQQQVLDDVVLGSA
jgi:uncharacterized protein (TIGR02246 family)